MHVRDKRDLHYDPKEGMRINPKLAKAPPDEVSVDELLVGVKRADLQQGSRTGYGKYAEGQGGQTVPLPTEAGGTGFASYRTAARVAPEDVEEDDVLEEEGGLLEGLDGSADQDIGAAVKAGLRQFGAALYPGWKKDAAMVKVFSEATASLCGISEKLIVEHLMRNGG